MKEFKFKIPDGKISNPPSQDLSLKTKSSELGGALNSN
jgi:hypothetical protein